MFKSAPLRKYPSFKLQLEQRLWNSEHGYAFIPQKQQPLCMGGTQTAEATHLHKVHFEFFPQKVSNIY